MSRHLKSTIFALLPLCLLAGPVGAGLKDYSSSRQIKSFKEREGVMRFSRDLSDTAKRITVKVKLKVTEGVVTVRLEDPYGRPKWDKRIEAATSSDKPTKIELDEWFNAKSGEWRLLLIFEKASGRYNVKMSTR